MKYMKKVIIFSLLVATVFVFTQTSLFAGIKGSKSTVTTLNEQYKWSLADLYATQEAWEIDYALLQKEFIPRTAIFNGKLLNKKDVIACLTHRDEMMKTMDKVYVYAYLNCDLDQSNNSASELKSRAETLNAEALTSVAFIQPELLSLPQPIIDDYMNSPDLKEYHHYFDLLLKQKAHTLSKAEEELLAAASDIAGSPVSIFDNATVSDMKFPKIKDNEGKEIQLSEGIYSKILEDTDRDYRKRAFEGILGAYNEKKNTLAATLNAEVKKNIFFAKARKYESSLEASLAAESIPTSVYNNLIGSVNNNVGFLQKYVNIRKKVMNLDKVHAYDMFVPLVDNYQLSVPYEDSKKIVLESLAPFGEEYTTVLKTGFDNRWIDVFETNHKATGAYQWGAYGSHPFVLLNYNNTFDSMLTLSHEMGHAVNSFYSNNAQKYVNSNVPIFNAEVASTTNELMMLKYMIKNAKNDDEKLYFINSYIEMIRGTVYTQVIFSQFEKEIHEKVENGEALSADSFAAIWQKLMEKFYGDSFAIDKLGLSSWARISHFYMNFYVYKYATSLAASNELVKNMTEGSDTAQAANKEKYMTFLKGGSTDYPIEQLKAAGVDMSTTTPVDNLLIDFGVLIDQMEQILKSKGKL